MQLELTLQPLRVYTSTNTTLQQILHDLQHEPFSYGIVTGRFGKLEGFFSSFELLHYCLTVGLEHIDDVDHLRGFTKHLNPNFCILDAIPVSIIPIEQQQELLVIKQANHYIGCIDRIQYLEAVAKMQQRQLKHYETIFQAMPNGVIAVDIEGRIIMMNCAGEKITGVPYEKAIGQFITNVVPPKGILQVLQTGQGQIEKYKVRKRWYISYREPIYDGKQLVGAVGVFDDISKIETLTSNLETYRQLLRENEMLLNTSDMGIAVMDLNGDVLRQNERFQHLYLAILSADYERSQFRHAFQQLIKGQRKEKVAHIQTKQRWLKCRFSSIQGAEAHSIDRIIVQIEDTTSEYEQQRKTMLLTQHIRHYLSINTAPHIPISEEFDERLHHIAKVNAPVLLIGQRGTGRTLTAHQIIRYSERHMMPFIEIDCINHTKKHLEQLLFNIYDPPPILSLVAGGTLFIKNIDYLSHTLQERFIYLLEKINALNVRLITSISTQLEPPQHVNEQLYYAINAIQLTHPPLQERFEQAQTVLLFMLQQLCEKHQRNVTLPQESIAYLLQANWLDGFRSIHLLFEHLCLNLQADIWRPFHFQQLQLEITQQTVQKPIIVNTIFPLKEAVNEVEKEMLLLLMEQNISYRQMAKLLDVNPSTIIRKIRKMEVHLHGQ